MSAPPLNHQRRRTQRFYRSEPLPQLNVALVGRLCLPSAPIRIERDVHPIAILETFRSGLELRVVKPTGRAPRVPLLAGEALGISADCLCATVGCHEPLIPPAAGLLECGSREPAARRIRESKRGNGGETLGPNRRQRVRHPRPNRALLLRPSCSRDGPPHPSHPARIVSAERKPVGPKRLNHGATQRNPACSRCGTTPRHPRTSSGHPCSSRTKGPS
jgi:hypothetical protein